ncbi:MULTISPECIES: hypothetical protein [unclassified Streptomyces]|uniref:hypothetical protein n=1 Tax=unclassified Streptomyces TaxID=2593676 RepID=UPI002DDBE172|nr:hypothetical protein [Streptomyces sp. NBC_01750]WSD33171.1 hypothetical protein OG966_15405 [Streptomyces sp. NBC_01750]
MDRAPGERRSVEGHRAAGELRSVELGHAAGERGAGEVPAVEDDAGEIQVAALPGVGVLGGKAEVVADEADDCVPDFAHGQVGVPGIRVAGR